MNPKIWDRSLGTLNLIFGPSWPYVWRHWPYTFRYQFETKGIWSISINPKIYDQTFGCPKCRVPHNNKNLILASFGTMLGEPDHIHWEVNLKPNGYFQFRGTPKSAPKFLGTQTTEYSITKILIFGPFFPYVRWVWPYTSRDQFENKVLFSISMNPKICDQIFSTLSA